MISEWLKSDVLILNLNWAPLHASNKCQVTQSVRGPLLIITLFVFSAK